jgi:integral membrane sensor domain MASE1
MNPPIVVRDAAASVLLVVIEVGRQDHRLWLRWWLGASHAYSVAGVSTVLRIAADS